MSYLKNYFYQIVNLKPDDYSHVMSIMISSITNNMNSMNWKWLTLFTKVCFLILYLIILIFSIHKVLSVTIKHI